MKEELSKKGSMLVKLKEDKMGRPSRLDGSPSKTSGDREKDELKKQIRQLENKLSSINKAEKPLESLVPLPEPEQHDSVEKQVSTHMNTRDCCIKNANNTFLLRTCIIKLINCCYKWPHIFNI